MKTTRNNYQASSNPVPFPPHSSEIFWTTMMKQGAVHYDSTPAVHFRLSRAQQQAVTSVKYAALVRLEGRVATRILVDLLPEQSRHSGNNTGSFHWLQSLGQIANTYDSFADCITDIQNGRVSAGNPTRLRLALARAGARDIIPVVRDLTGRELFMAISDAVGVLRGTKK